MTKIPWSVMAEGLGLKMSGLLHEQLFVDNSVFPVASATSKRVFSLAFSNSVWATLLFSLQLVRVH